MKNTPRIYVGTYGKYNSGSLYGAWLDLDDYTDNDEFYAACSELHKSEHDPEFMFQDWEGIPEQFISESGLSPDYWEYKYMEFLDNSYMNEDAIAAGLELDIPLEKLEETYSGEFDSDEDFAQDMVEQLGLLPEELNWPGNCIDWEKAARELMWDYSEQNGHYFSSNY